MDYDYNGKNGKVAKQNIESCSSLAAVQNKWALLMQMWKTGFRWDEEIELAKCQTYIILLL